VTASEPQRLALAVLTERLTTRRLRYASHLAHRAAAAVANTFGPHAWKRPRPEALGGHYGVTRSLIHGLRGIDLSWAYQPDLRRQAAETALVLSGADVLRQAIDRKREGRCNRLLAGPNIMVLPDQHGGVMLSDAIDVVVVPSEWVKAMYEACAPALRGRIAVWPAGVDTDYWRPYGSPQRRLVLIYSKLGRRRAEAVRALLHRHGHPTAMVSYGFYSPARYRRLLNAAKAMVAITESESQGLALAEAWAMNVPTLVIDNRIRTVEGMRVEISTAPYLSAATGRFWTEPEELEACLDRSALAAFAPRGWVLENMSDRVAADKLLAIAFPEAGGARRRRAE